MGKQAQGPEYEFIEDMAYVRQHYFRIQIAVAFLGLRGSTDSRKILHKIGLSAPIVSNYLNQMDCVTVIEGEGERNGSGDAPSLVIRDSFAGDICEDCDRVNNCIIRMAKLNSNNLKHVPQSLARRMILE